MDLHERARLLYRGEALAPMVRASTTPLRTLALEYGADFVYTEELIDRAISDTIRVENEELGTIDYIKDTSKFSEKQLRRMGKEGAPKPVLLRIDPAKEKGKLVCQLGTGEPDLALPAARHVCKDVDAIDINMGCPKKFSVSGGMGSALLDDPDRASRIIKSLTAELSVPVSAKIRLLKDDSSTLDFIKALIEAGAKAVAIHGRTVGHDSTEPALWDRLQNVVTHAKSQYPSVPILLNGDFYTRKEIVEFREATKADGVLLARPALYNTSIFRKPEGQQIKTDQLSYDSTLLLDKSTVVRDYLRHAIRYETDYKNVKYVVCEFMSNRRTPAYRVPSLPLNFPGGQTVAKVCACHSLSDVCKVWDVDTSSIRTGKEQAPSGLHRFEDSYFLGTNHEKKNTLEPDSKKARVELQ